MQVFTNKFSMATNQDKTEVVLNFFQNVPTIPSDTDQAVVPCEMETNVFPVANLVMTGEFARGFAETLNKLLAAE